LLDNLRALDRAVYRVERVLAGSLFLVGAGVMLLNVLQKVYARPEGKLSLRLLRTLNGLGVDPDPGLVHGPVSLALNVALCFLLTYAALRTIKRERPLGTRRALGMAFLVTAALVGATKLMLLLLPNGLIWAPRAALACMLWIGFLGASTATFDKRHLALEMGDKIWPRAMTRYVQAFALLTAAALCLFLLVLSVLSIPDYYGRWLVNTMAEGENLSSELLIPTWVLLLVLPYTFSLMAVRLLAQSWTKARGGA